MYCNSFSFLAQGKRNWRKTVGHCCKGKKKLAKTVGSCRKIEVWYIFSFANHFKINSIIIFVDYLRNFCLVSSLMSEIVAIFCIFTTYFCTKLQFSCIGIACLMHFPYMLPIYSIPKEFSSLNCLFLSSMTL